MAHIAEFALPKLRQNPNWKAKPTKSASTKAEEMCLGDSEKEIQAGRSRILAQSTLDGSCRRLDDAANDGPHARKLLGQLLDCLHLADASGGDGLSP